MNSDNNSENNLEDKKKLLDEIKQIISKITRIECNKISDHASLRNDLMLDSLQAAQIVALLEEKYEIKIDEVEIFNVDTVIDVMEIIKEYSNNKL